MTTPLVSSNLLDAQPKSKPRKLINTNVVELYSRITKDQTQLTYYNSGIGTYAKPFWLSFAYVKQVLLNRFDLAIAWDFDKAFLEELTKLEP
ncbi:hypothetical protein FRC09_002359 [Ceratobasidium sp. 395]|nr:hypothetical protein FRC09_002359 [Ceratobasidium sp. 395]